MNLSVATLSESRLISGAMSIVPVWQSYSMRRPFKVVAWCTSRSLVQPNADRASASMGAELTCALKALATHSSCQQDSSRLVRESLAYKV